MIIRDLGSNEKRKGVAFPTLLTATPGEWAYSEPVTLTMVEPVMFSLQREWMQFSVDGGDYQTAPREISSGAVITLRAMPSSNYGESIGGSIFINGAAGGGWRIQTRNDYRAPKEWRVGADREHKQVSEIASLLVSGDTVYLDPGVYAPFELTRPGAADSAIVLIGDDVVVEGGTVTCSLKEAHYNSFIGIHFAGGSVVGFRNEAHGTVLDSCTIRDTLGHGILGADFNSGSLSLLNCSVRNVAKGNTAESAQRHAVYVATDFHAFPESTLLVAGCDIRDFHGNGIKSRAHNTAVSHTTIEQSEAYDPNLGKAKSFYTIELVGPDGRPQDTPFPAAVWDCDLIHKKNVAFFGMRIGSDGTGASNGQVRIHHNRIHIPANPGGAPLIRMQGKLDSLDLRDNIIHAPATGWQMLKDEVNVWYSGFPQITQSNNQIIPLDTTVVEPVIEPTPVVEPEPAPAPTQTAVPQVSVTRKGYWIVTANGAQVSQHVADPDAFESALNQVLSGATGVSIQPPSYEVRLK